MSDELLELPEGWERVQLENVAQVIMGQSPPGESYNQIGNGVPLVNGPVEFGSSAFSKTVRSKFTTSPTKMCQEGDLIICVRGSTTGRMNISGFEACIGRGVAVLRAQIYQPYLNFVIHAKQEEIYRLGTGSTFPNVSSDVLNKLLIPLPPLNEQRRIVAAIKSLRDRSQNARSALSAIPELCNKFRQSVLAAAFRGNLTADWREQNPDVEPASVLLEKIRRDRRKQWEESELSRITSTKKPFDDEKWKLKYKEPSRLDDSELTELPDGWIWASVEEFADVGTGATPLRNELKYYENGNIPWITSGALNNLFITEAEEYITSIAIQETNAKVFPTHTLLIAMYGEGKTWGKVSELLIEAATNQACAALVMNGVSRKIQPIVKLFFQKNYTDIRRLASGGVQPNLNLSMIKNTAVPLPPLQEQMEIIQVIARCMSIVDNIEKQHQESEEKLDCFNRSILAKAFRGELVEQDPNDEPAAVLLERIRAEREQQAQTPSNRRKRLAK